MLHNINLTLRRGEVVGIAGLVGAGRTELARVLFGADRADSGRLWLRGKETEVSSPRAAIAHGLGFLTEDRKTQGLVLGLDLCENTCLPSLSRLSAWGIMQPKREITLTERYISDLRIKTPSARQRVVNLSGGNQQKVVLSKWLCTDADILIFDEPTRGIDVGAKVEIYQLMNQLAARGAGILMISSELPEILGMSDRILVMNRGRIAGEFTAGTATQENLLNCAIASPTAA